MLAVTETLCRLYEPIIHAFISHEFKNRLSFMQLMFISFLHEPLYNDVWIKVQRFKLFPYYPTLVISDKW